MAGTFLTAEWRKLVMVNYAVDPAVLQSFIPYKTELDLWQNTCYVSLVGFMFLNTRLIGVRVPFHADFEEVNLRFYVTYGEGGERKRGVVFLREIVPRRALTFIANKIYGENYVTMPMDHKWQFGPDHLSIHYQWRLNEWNSVSVRAVRPAEEIMLGSEEEFITEHYWGYTKVGDEKTSEYKVQMCTSVRCMETGLHFYNMRTLFLFFWRRDRRLRCLVGGQYDKLFDQRNRSQRGARPERCEPSLGPLGPSARTALMPLSPRHLSSHPTSKPGKGSHR
jgi:uncharacterized protein YqjF (DUF2071 family)